MSYGLYFVLFYKGIVDVFQAPSLSENKHGLKMRFNIEAGQLQTVIWNVFAETAY